MHPGKASLAADQPPISGQQGGAPLLLILLPLPRLLPECIFAAGGEWLVAAALHILGAAAPKYRRPWKWESICWICLCLPILNHSKWRKILCHPEFMNIPSKVCFSSEKMVSPLNFSVEKILAGLLPVARINGNENEGCQPNVSTASLLHGVGKATSLPALNSPMALGILLESWALGLAAKRVHDEQQQQRPTPTTMAASTTVGKGHGQKTPNGPTILTASKASDRLKISLPAGKESPQSDEKIVGRNNKQLANGVGAQFRCHICAKTFSAHYNLTRHMPVHTGARPFQCKARMA